MNVLFVDAPRALARGLQRGGVVAAIALFAALVFALAGLAGLGPTGVVLALLGTPLLRACSRSLGYLAE
ncbi:MAG: hypothetical protein GEU88_17280 [Solirubrobacterales bacterium]|nr:hypothetical protein [Solirubrobacterales bacterium]